MNRRLGSLLAGLAILIAATGPSAIAATAPGARMTVSGQVNDQDGNPQPGVQVVVTCKLGESSEERGGAVSPTTSADGRFQLLGVPAGECFFMVNAPWTSCGPIGGPDTARLTIREGVNVENLALTAPAHCKPEPEGLVAGRVVDGAGVGLGGYIIYPECGDCGYPECGPDCTTSRPCGYFGGTEAAADGRFELTAIAGPCRLRACKADSSGECPGELAEGPCKSGEPCAVVVVSTETPVTGLVLKQKESRP